MMKLRCNKEFNAIKNRAEHYQEKFNNDEEIDIKYVSMNLHFLEMLFALKIVEVENTHILINNMDIEQKVVNYTKELIQSGKKDRTLYEWSTSEIIINEYMKEELDLESQFIVGKIVMDNIISKKNFPDKAIFYFEFTEEFGLRLRFHKRRNDEEVVLSMKDIENKNFPAGYYIIE